MLHLDSGDDQSGLGHEYTSRPLDCPLCRETSVLDVNEPNTLGATTSGGPVICGNVARMNPPERRSAGSPNDNLGETGMTQASRAPDLRSPSPHPDTRAKDMHSPFDRPFVWATGLENTSIAQEAPGRRRLDEL